MEEEKSAGKVWINLPKEYVKERANRETGEAFYSVSLPKGVTVDGRDLGGYQFTCKYASDSKFGGKGISFPEDWNVRLTKSLGQMTDGGWVPETDAEGTPLVDRVEIPVKNLAEAVKAEHHDYVAAHPREKAEDKAQAAPAPAHEAPEQTQAR